MDSIVGMMWNRNEGDILDETIVRALDKVDSLFIADDGSTDNSWEIIKSFEKNPKVELIRNSPIKGDQGQRQAMLNEIRRRYKPENTWVQIIESDIHILDTDIREALDNYAVADIALSWQTLNAVRKKGTWDEVDTYPEWGSPISDIMPYAHWMEVMIYTFRPLPNLNYDKDRWRPWPAGWKHYTREEITNRRRYLDAPLLAHYGYRGPTYYWKKCQRAGMKRHRKYGWDLRSREKVEETVYFFNGQWNGNPFPMSREGYRGWRKG